MCDYPDIGMIPRHRASRRQGYKVLVLEKNFVLYKVEGGKKRVVIYVIGDQKLDYLNILRGL